MTENELQDMLVGFIDMVAYMDQEELDEAELYEWGAFEDASVRSYSEGGYLTNDTGLVITLADGSEFQITIRQVQ